MNYLRLKKRKEFLRILKEGKRAYGSTLTVVYLPAERTAMAVCVGKKYGKSVERNHIKRLLREAFRRQRLAVPVQILLLPKVAESYAFAPFCRDLEKIFRKEKLADG